MHTRKNEYVLFNNQDNNNINIKQNDNGQGTLFTR